MRKAKGQNSHWQRNNCLGDGISRRVSISVNLIEAFTISMALAQALVHSLYAKSYLLAIMIRPNMGEATRRLSPHF